MRTKSFLLFIPTFLMLSCSSSSTPQPYLLTKHRSDLCQQELEQSISTLINAKHLQLSKNTFSTKSFLYLSNQKRSILGSSMIINDLNGRKKLLLYKKENILYIGISNKRGDVLKSQVVQNCLSLSTSLGS